jgi:hypothetical protein
VRRLHEELKDAALDAARARVNAKKSAGRSHRDSSSCLIDDYCSRKTTTSGTVIDLHYTTTAQAVTLAKEYLRDHGASNSERDSVQTLDVGADMQANCSLPYGIHHWAGYPFHWR